MSNVLQNLPINFTESVDCIVPAHEARPELPLDFRKIREGENRLVEAKVVNMSTYSELEFTFNEGYREAKKNLSVVGYEISQAKRSVRKVKGEFILDEYPGFLKERGLKDNSANREAYLERQDSYVAAMDRVSMLEALEFSLESNVKVFENVCRYMKKEMDMLIRSGSMDSNKY